MPQVGVTACAGNFRSRRPVALVLMQMDGLGVCRHRKARPATPRLELGVRAEKFSTARSAAITAVSMVPVELARECGLGALLPHDVILFRGQLGAPFGIGLLDFVQLLNLLVCHILCSCLIRCVKSIEDALRTESAPSPLSSNAARSRRSPPERLWAAVLLRSWNAPALPRLPVPDN